MRIPHRDSRAYKVAMWLHKNGGATKNECIAAFPEDTPQKVRDSINYLYHENMASDRDGVYTLKPYLATHFDQCEPQEREQLQIVPPRTPKPFTELSAKYMLPKVPPREDALPLREIAFKTGSIGFYAGYRA